MKIEDQLNGELRRIEACVKKGEGQSIEARWKFGHALLQSREGKQLPRGMVAAVAREHKISTREVQYRISFAETFTTEDEVRNALRTYPSWRQIVSKALPKKTAEPKPTPPWDERIAKRLDRIIDEAEAEDELKTLAELLHKVLERLEPIQEVAA